MRCFRSGVLAVLVVFSSAVIAAAAECPTCKRQVPSGGYCPFDGTKIPDAPVAEPKPEPKPEPKVEAPKPEPKVEAPKPEPKKEAPKPEPKKEAPKPEPKVEAPKPVSAKEAMRAKEQAAAQAYDAAAGAYKANPGDFDGAIGKFEAARKTAEGTKYAPACDKMIASVKARKAEAEAAARLTAARTAYEGAVASYRKAPADHDAGLAAFAEARKKAAGTPYEKKCDEMTERLGREKAKAAAAAPKPAPKPEPKVEAPKPEPKKEAPNAAKPALREAIIAKVEAAPTARTAFEKAQALEAVPGQSRQARAEAALPYYYAAITTKGANGARGPEAAPAAMRVAEIVEKSASTTRDLACAGKFYLVSANLDPANGAWLRAEKPMIKAGQGREYAAALAGISAKAGECGEEKLAATIKARADRLALKFGQ
jgi:outer membrane biosynthesis protein TonB